MQYRIDQKSGNKLSKKLYILAELDEETQTQIRRIEKIILENGLTGQQTKDIPYHITINSFSSNNENELINMIEDIKTKTRKFSVSFSSLGLFGLKVLFLNPDVNINLADLFNYTKRKNLHKDDFLSAHATLLIDEPENIIKILPKISENFQRISGTIKYISLYEFFPKRFIKRVELG